MPIDQPSAVSAVPVQTLACKRVLPQQRARPLVEDKFNGYDAGVSDRRPSLLKRRAVQELLGLLQGFELFCSCRLPCFKVLQQEVTLPEKFGVVPGEALQ